MKIDKRKLFILICLAVIAAVVIVFAVTTIGKKIKTETPGLPGEAYTRKVGSAVRVVLSKPEESDYRWVAEIDGKDRANLSVKEKNKAKKQVFVVSSQGSRFVRPVTFRLQNRSDASDCVYELSVFFQADKKGNLTFREAKGEIREKTVRGQIGDKEYRIFKDGKNLVFEVSRDPETDFSRQFDGDGSGLTVTGPVFTEDSLARMTFSQERRSPVSDKTDESEGGDSSEEAEQGTDKKAGEASERFYTVDVFSEQLLKKVTFRLKLDAAGDVTLLSHRVSDYEIAVVADEEAKKEFVKEYGEVKLPANARKISYETGKIYVSQEDEEGLSAAQITFAYDGKNVDYRFSDGVKSEEAFFWKYLGGEEQRSESEVKGVRLTAIVLPDGYITVTWTVGGIKYALSMENGSLKDAEKIIEELV